LDGDATTSEIISELIYDNSTTLDGQGFAQEFITRRRADAASKKSPAARHQLLMLFTSGFSINLLSTSHTYRSSRAI